VKETSVRADAFVEALDDERIVAAIRGAEARSRGEIRVHVSDGDVLDARAEAAAVFERLEMARTAERNGVLILVAPEGQSLAVIGDRGLDACCGTAFWETVAAAIREAFRAGHYTEGIVAGVAAVGDELARHFPRRPGEEDRNELPDGVSRGQGATG
jgi:uncharacterized membrane protein YgcG